MAPGEPPASVDTDYDTSFVPDVVAAAGFPLVDDHNKPGAVGGGRMPMMDESALAAVVEQVLTGSEFGSSL